MTNLEIAVQHILNNNLLEGKKIIHSSLYEKMGKLLEEKLVEFAPTIFNEELKGKQHKIDANKNGKIDSEDFPLLRKKKMNEEEEGEEDEDEEEEDEDEKEMKEAKKEEDEEEEDEDEEEEDEDEEDEDEKNESYNLSEEEMQEILAQMIEEIEQETGKELNEEEVQQVVDRFLQEFN